MVVVVGDGDSVLYVAGATVQITGECLFFVLTKKHLIKCFRHAVRPEKNCPHAVRGYSAIRCNHRGPSQRFAPPTTQ